jgi:uncharacterized protein YukE
MNPLALAAPSFWQTAENMDTILARAGSSTKPITPQLRKVASIDLAGIKKVAEDVWGIDPRDATLATAIAQSWGTLNRAQNQANEAWNGEAYQAFEQYLSTVQTWLSNARPHVEAVSKALRDMADRLETNLAKMMETLSSGAGLIGTVMGTLSAIAAALAVTPEPVISKIAAAVVSVILAIIAIAAFIVKMVNEHDEKMRKIQAAIESTERLKDSI